MSSPCSDDSLTCTPKSPSLPCTPAMSQGGMASGCLQMSLREFRVACPAQPLCSVRARGWQKQGVFSAACEGTFVPLPWCFLGDRVDVQAPVFGARPGTGTCSVGRFLWHCCPWNLQPCPSAVCRDLSHSGQDKWARDMQESQGQSCLSAIRCF